MSNWNWLVVGFVAGCAAGPSAIFLGWWLGERLGLFPDRDYEERP